MRKTEGYVLMGFNFITEPDGKLYCIMKLVGRGQTIYEKYEVDFESSHKLQAIANTIYLNNKQVQ